ncbi:soluble epoxide hydrolase / lipid-phosphate phosphatase [Pararobbsia alpina]|uniref:alpha/beta fold hydrolase n=1 Tax=Pararobbsia alpina TaxID=621374 RepID=UPI0039A43355
MPATDERKIRTNGIDMHIVQQGEGPMILLCHGFPETSHSWRHQLPALAQAGFRAVAPDMRGYGQTDSPAAVAAFGIQHLVADMVGVLDALGESQAIIVGSDWGATVAWQAALTRPDRFRGVMALGVPMMASPPVPPTQLFPQTADALLYTLYFQAEGPAETEFQRDIRQALLKILFWASGDAGPRAIDTTIPSPFSMVSRSQGLLAALPIPSKRLAWLEQEDLDTYTQAFAHSGFRGGLNYYRNLDANWALERSRDDPKIEVPAAFIAGERDPGLSIPGMQEIIAAMPALVPRLQSTAIIPDCGHWVSQERPEELSSAIIEFASRIDRL